MEYLKVKNWNKFQHFKDRKPPWIKLYRDLLDDVQWYELEPKAAKALVMIWLIASEDEGQFPTGKELAFRLRTTEKEINTIIPKLYHWLEQDDINTISTRYQDDTPETETETETEKRQKDSKLVFGAFKNVKLTNEEKAKLDDKFTLSLADSLIEELSEGIASKGYRYKDHYATILNWARRKGYGKPTDGAINDNLFLRSLQQADGRKPSE